MGFQAFPIGPLALALVLSHSPLSRSIGVADSHQHFVWCCLFAE
jgi:hypothetical protein